MTPQSPEDQFRALALDLVHAWVAELKKPENELKRQRKRKRTTKRAEDGGKSHER